VVLSAQAAGPLPSLSEGGDLGAWWSFATPRRRGQGRGMDAGLVAGKRVALGMIAAGMGRPRNILAAADYGPTTHRHRQVAGKSFFL
jgi:hypothetical protein